MRMRTVLIALLCGLAVSSVPGAVGQDRPHVLLILADDLGYSDLGAYGGEISTPHLDRLAAQGLRFTHFANAGRCCPSRAALLTGLYPHQSGMGWMTAADLHRPGYTGELSPSSLTLAEALSTSGYSAYMAGKWHLTRSDHESADAAKDSWPRQRGFDRFFGVLRGGSYHASSTLVEENERLPSPEGSAFHLTDALTEQAIRFIQQHFKETPDRPFFTYLAYTAPHWPLHAPEEDIAPYRSVYTPGWDVLRQKRFERLQSLGLIDPGQTLPPRPDDVPAWDSLEISQQADLVERMAIYAAQVERMDRRIGEVIATLDGLDQLDNTLILFLSDNGASAEGGPFGFERHPGTKLGSPESFASYGKGWASLSNTPFRGFKKSTFEGGIASPLIAHWPKRIVERGRLRSRPAHAIDLFPTLLELAGAPYPSHREAHALPPLPGRSLLPLFKGMSQNERILFWEHEGNRALRKGPWKLTSTFGAPWELYHLENDRSEMHDLASELPSITRELSTLWEAAARRYNVLPLDGRSWEARLAGVVADEITAREKPNVVLILCDDLGYGDLGCYGSSKHLTPRIDRMAEEGVTLTHFYSSSGFCTPSRASLLTGCYAQRVGMHMNYLPPGTSTMRQVLFPVAWRGLHPEETTLAEALKPLGYATACIGKWHLGDQLPFLPTRQGFDHYFGIPYSNDMGAQQFPINPPLPLLRGETVIEAPVEQATLTQRYTEEAVKFIADQGDRQPFFLYLPHTMPHHPVHVSEDFEGHTGHGAYADCVAEIDWSTGRILDALEEQGISENTLVIFTSDNGAARAWGGGNAPLSGFKGTTSEGGMRVPCIVRWPGRLPEGQTSAALTSTLDFFPTLLKLAGGALTDDRKIDGEDMWPLLENAPEATAPSKTFYYYQQDQLQAVRKGPWKLYLPQEATRLPLGSVNSRRATPPRLFHLGKDPAEKKNVAQQQPEVFANLTALAQLAREDLGDLNRPGKGMRSAGMAERPFPLLKAAVPAPTDGD